MLTAVFTDGTLNTENIILLRLIKIFKGWGTGGWSEGNFRMFEIMKSRFQSCPCGFVSGWVGDGGAGDGGGGVVVILKLRYIEYEDGRRWNASDSESCI